MYKRQLIYSGIKQLNELMSEGITPEDAERFYPPELKEGDLSLIHIFIGSVSPDFRKSLYMPILDAYAHMRRCAEAIENLSLIHIWRKTARSLRRRPP